MSTSTAATPAIAAFTSMSRALLPQDGQPSSGQPSSGLTIRILASSGTSYVAYLGYGYEEQTEPGSWDASLKFDGAALAAFEFFRPYTTTLIRLYIERQVMPLDPRQPATLLTWDSAAVDPSSQIA